MPTVSELIENLTRWYKPDEVLAVHIWSKEDVLHTLNSLDFGKPVEFTDEDCNNVLLSFDNHCDSEYGLTWIGLQDEIEYYVKNVLLKLEST